MLTASLVVNVLFVGAVAVLWFLLSEQRNASGSWQSAYHAASERDVYANGMYAELLERNSELANEKASLMNAYKSVAESNNELLSRVERGREDYDKVLSRVHELSIEMTEKNVQLREKNDELGALRTQYNGLLSVKEKLARRLVCLENRLSGIIDIVHEDED